jgi:hypothetical protein
MLVAVRMEALFPNLRNRTVSSEVVRRACMRIVTRLSHLRIVEERSMAQAIVRESAARNRFSSGHGRHAVKNPEQM